MKRKLIYDDCDIDNEQRCSTNKEVEPQNDTASNWNFEPAYFLRCHSKKNDSADVQTQIWQCAFEPSASKSKLIASCGGNSVCFINVHTGCVEGKYYSSVVGDIFYSLCWTTVSNMNNEENIIAVGGNSKDIHLLHPKEGVVFFKHRLLKKKREAVSSLVFHPFQNNLLFCGLSNGVVSVFDVGCPFPPFYKTKFYELYTLSAESEIFSLSYCASTNILLSACNDGLRGWKILEEDKMKNAVMMKFEHPVSTNAAYGGSQLVDSVESLGNGLVASKCALHGNIYVWNLKVTLLENKNVNLFKITPSYILKWKDTDNYFMNIGYNADCHLLACGDDNGAIWLYDTHSFSSKCSKKTSVESVKPSVVLPWPQVQDVYSEKKRKLRLDVYDIVVDRVCVDSSGRYVIAVTSNNMVCIWKRVQK